MTPKWHFVRDLTISDLEKNPVWEFCDDDSEAPDTAIRPVKILPVSDLAGRLIGTKAKLYNGTFCWALLSNISLQNPRRTKYFLCVSLEKNGHWFDLARYHDVDYERRGPLAMAKFLGLSIREVFPVEYDISAIAIGMSESVRGFIKADIDEKLTKEELINMSLEE